MAVPIRIHVRRRVLTDDGVCLVDQGVGRPAQQVPMRALCFRRRHLSFCVPRLCFQCCRPWGGCPWPSSAASRICFRGGATRTGGRGTCAQWPSKVRTSRTRSGRDGPGGPQSTCRFHRGQCVPSSAIAIQGPPAAHAGTPGGRPRSANAATRVQSRSNGPPPHRPGSGWPVRGWYSTHGVT